MKTSLIHLSPTADWRAAVARVRGGPRNARLVLRLMQRRSLRMQVPLAVVTADAYLRAESAKLGLPLFANTRQARSADWGLGQPALFPTFLRPITTAKMLRSQATSRRAAIRP